MKKSVILYLLTIRFRQFGRMINEIGWLLIIILLPLIGIGFLGVLESATKQSSPFYPVLILFGLYSIHLNRKDFTFLKRLKINQRFLFMAEYAVLLAPFLIGWLFLGRWDYSLILLLGILPISMFVDEWAGIKSWTTTIPMHFLPEWAFSWKSGFRKYFIFLFLLYLVGILLSKYTFTILLVIIFYALIVIGFFDELENKELFEQYYFTKANFLFFKLSRHSLLFHAILFPLYCLFLIFHFNYWYILLAVIFAAQLLVGFAIIYKYAHFAPGRKRAMNSLACGIFFLFMLVPFLFQVVLGYCVYYWSKAQKNLKSIYVKH